ncbi:MAG: hypothetical protein R2685_07850 [Candidatus Nitrosocosmicus sp.]|nr:hypothetical protein [Candidatus Nitrosocosmicus sp.]
MVSDISVKVRVKLDIVGYKDIHLEFCANGSNFAEIRKGSEEFVKDYLIFNNLTKARNVEFSYCDKEGLIVNTVDNFLDNIF